MTNPNDLKPAPLRFCIVAGEASGDILGADLIIALRQRYPEAEFEGVAGPLMQAAGCTSLFPMETLSVMGLLEVIKHLPSILNLHRKLVRHLKQHPPTIYIGIDAPDTNLRIAKKIQHLPIPVVQYVSPSVWAWRQKRIVGIAKTVDLMLTLFPFEAAFYQEHNVPVNFIGHTLADTIPLQVDQSAARAQLNISTQVPVLALLPGSRKSEIARHAPIFLDTARICVQKLPELQIIVPMANEKRAEQFKTIWAEIAPELPITILIQNSALALSAADSVLTVSGTATLEAMLYKRNMVVAYKMPKLTFLLAQKLVTFTYISLPNLLAQERLVPEFIQEDVEPANLSRHVLQQLLQPEKFKPVYAAFNDIHKQLKQNASLQAAAAIATILS